MKLESLCSWFFLSLAIFCTGPLVAADRGETYFNAICAQCHGNEGRGNQEIAAPSIAGLPSWYVLAQLKKFTEGARGKHPQDNAGMRMRPLAKTLLEKDWPAVATYVAALPRISPPATISGRVLRGQTKFQQVCASCHGVDAKGNESLQAPPLVGQNDWYLRTQILNFKSGVRGFDPSIDAMGSAMRGMAMLLDDEGISDMMAFLNALSGDSGKEVVSE